MRTRVERLLAESPQWTGGKQQLTATRLHELLRAEGHQVGITLVKEAVAEWRRQPAKSTFRSTSVEAYALERECRNGSVLGMKPLLNPK